MKVKYLTPDQIDDIAEKIRAYFGIVSDINIDITDLASKLNCNVFETEFDDDTVSGLIKKENDGYSIYINRNEIEERKRFTIAHELSHLILHSSLIEEGKSFIDYRKPLGCYQKGNELRKEIQANMLAASLLMPKNLVNASWSEKPTLDDIAELFNVSKKAAMYRLESLNLLY